MSENYVPLYRKYRPQTLETLVGQEHVKKTLTSAIELGRISHAYLFTGPRGTGKTSTARILAKSLNCKNGPTIHPCGECESCKDITNTVPIDVIEIDAASNRSVEDTQNILEKIQYAPVNGKYKIYIIDEVHMLSNQAFNALLKTLEEPPENVIFILATTEVHKVLDTIKSRCQRFDFRRITTEDIVKHLRYISDEENINISDDALYTIAKNSAGGMRDSISLLDQLSLLGVKSQITPDDVNSVLGRISFDTLHTLSEKIISSSPNEGIEVLNNIYNSGNEPLQILTNLSEYFKNLLIAKNCKKELLSELTGLNEPQMEILLKQKEKLETQQIVFLLERISYYIKEIKTAMNQHLWLEVAVIDFANMTENTTLLDLQNRIKALESNGIGNYSAKQQINVEKTESVRVKQAFVEPEKDLTASVSKQETEKINTQEEDFTPPPISHKTSGNDLQSLWETLLTNLKSPATRALLNLATPVKISKEEVIITFKNDKLVSQVTSGNKKDMLVDAVNTMYAQSDSKVVIRLPQAGDEELIKSASSVQAEKKNLVSTPIKSEKKQIDESEFKQELTVQDEINQNNTDSSESLLGVDEDEQAKDVKRIESDQERMILELFDGKYID